mmetsp:Transcript_32616/g.73918  ORF Transcript_32616/g.73918 Transcript_32616/m.73918 type:complete len:249 (-) Transcript_32616:770-1516(-)
MPVVPTRGASSSPCYWRGCKSWRQRLRIQHPCGPWLLPEGSRSLRRRFSLRSMHVRRPSRSRWRRSLSRILFLIRTPSYRRSPYGGRSRASCLQGATRQTCGRSTVGGSASTLQACSLQAGVSTGRGWTWPAARTSPASSRMLLDFAGAGTASVRGPTSVTRVCPARLGQRRLGPRWISASCTKVGLKTSRATSSWSTERGTHPISWIQAWGQIIPQGPGAWRATMATGTYGTSRWTLTETPSGMHCG